MSADTTLVTEAPFVLTSVENGVAILTLNRPQRFNPLSSQMIAAIQAELDAIASDGSVQVVILAAEGKGFCAGHDLKEMRAHTEDKGWQQGSTPRVNSRQVTIGSFNPYAREDVSCE